MVWERYCNASQNPELFLFSLCIFSFISRLIWVYLGWNLHRWFSIHNQVNWCTIDPFSLKFCTSKHSYPVPLRYQPRSLCSCVCNMCISFSSLIHVYIQLCETAEPSWRWVRSRRWRRVSPSRRRANDESRDAQLPMGCPGTDSGGQCPTQSKRVHRLDRCRTNGYWDCYLNIQWRIQARTR